MSPGAGGSSGGTASAAGARSAARTRAATGTRSALPPTAAGGQSAARDGQPEDFRGQECDQEPEYEVLALKLAEASRPAASNFYSPTDHCGDMDMDFMVWLIRGAGRTVLLDTGFSRAEGERRGRRLDRTPAEALAACGVDPDAVDTVVISHAHYDHAGNVDEFPKARIVVQAAELAYVTGSAMTHPTLNHFFAAEDICHLVRRLHAGDVDVVDGPHELAPGIRLHPMPGHTPGMQVMEVSTRRGAVVLAVDALHYFENYSTANPFPAFVDLEELLDSYRAIGQLVDPRTHLIPGHDPRVFASYPAVEVSGPVSRRFAGADGKAGRAGEDSVPVVALHEEPHTPFET